MGDILATLLSPSLVNYSVWSVWLVGVEWCSCLVVVVTCFCVFSHAPLMDVHWPLYRLGCNV